MWKVVYWYSRLAVIAYPQLCKGKGQLAVRTHNIGQHEMDLNRRCAVVKTGPHMVLGWRDRETCSRRWSI